MSPGDCSLLDGGGCGSRSEGLSLPFGHVGELFKYKSTSTLYVLVSFLPFQAGAASILYQSCGTLLNGTRLVVLFLIGTEIMVPSSLFNPE